RIEVRRIEVRRIEVRRIEVRRIEVRRIEGSMVPGLAFDQGAESVSSTEREWAHRRRRAGKSLLFSR
ncbi:MAG: hypothetical protein JXR94_17015, partial [Candidatus Hydrogenedentes bacterium]|nr:hypothetical protein [Candidatus Hydrogenedentota bacterium]